MKDRKKEALIIILGSAFAVIVAAILYFTVFNKEKSNLNGVDATEIRLGNIEGCATTQTNTNYTSWTAGSWGSWQNGTSSCQTSEPTSSTSGTSYCQSEVVASDVCMSNGATSVPCNRTRTWTRSISSQYQTCTKCNAGYKLSSGTCIKCSAGTYATAGATSCSNCSTGYTSTAGASSCTLCASGYEKNASGACVKLAELTCSTKTYNGTQQQIASCSNCTIQSGNAYITESGTYTVTATPNSGYSFYDGKSTNSCEAKILSTTNDYKCYCDSKGTNCTWATSGNASFPNQTSYSESVCKGRETITCCYKNDNGTYVHGPTSTSNCVNTSDNKAQCEARNSVATYKCYCDSNGTNCTWATSGNASFPNPTSYSESVCKGRETITCCYKNDNGTYVHGPTSTSNCVNTSDNKAQCESRNNGNASIINCLNPTYNGTNQDIASCDGCRITEHAKETNVGSYEVKGTALDGYSDPVSRTCYIYRNRTATTGSCNSNLIYTNSNITLASGGEHVTYSNNSKKDVGSYEVTVTADSNYAFSDGSITKKLYCDIVSENTSTLKITSVSLNPTTIYLPLDDGTNYSRKTVNAFGLGNSSSYVSSTIDWSNVKGNAGVVSKSNLVSRGETMTNGVAIIKGINGGSCSNYNSKSFDIKGTDENGNIATGKLTVNVYCSKWNKSTGTYTFTSAQNNRFAMLSIAGCNAYEDLDETASVNGKYVYKTQYNRCCGCNSGTNNTPTVSYACYTNGTDYVWEESAPSGYTKVDGVTQKSRCIPACYSDGTNFEWTNNPKTGYTQVTTITTDTACRAEEPACYLYNGNYIWGKYQSTVGYVLQTSIKDENYCVTPEDNPELACYKNADDDYIWTETAPDGYTKVDDIDNPNACSAPEEPACYLYNNQYVWGAYGRLTGYSLISSILDENHCVKPNSACYISDDGNYVWGDYSLDNYYTLIKDINSKNACLPIEDVPKTDLDVAKVIYIGMSVLLVAGIGFIYYVNYSKKKNNK